MERDPAFGRARRTAWWAVMAAPVAVAVVFVAVVGWLAAIRAGHDGWVETTGVVRSVVPGGSADVDLTLPDGSVRELRLDLGRVVQNEQVELWYPPGSPEDAAVRPAGGFVVALGLMFLLFTTVNLVVAVPRLVRIGRLERLDDAPLPAEPCVVDVTVALGSRSARPQSARVLLRPDLPQVAADVAGARPDLVLAVDVDGLDGVEGVFRGEIVRSPGRRDALIRSTDGTFALAGHQLRLSSGSPSRARLGRRFIAPVPPVAATGPADGPLVVRTRIAASRVLGTAALGTALLTMATATVTMLVTRGEWGIGLLTLAALVAWLINRDLTRRMLRRSPRWAPVPPAAGGPGTPPLLVGPPVPLADGGARTEPLVSQALRVLGSPIVPSRAAVSLGAVGAVVVGVAIGLG